MLPSSAGATGSVLGWGTESHLPCGTAKQTQAFVFLPSGSWKSESSLPAGLGLAEGAPPGLQWPLSTAPHVPEGEGKLSSYEGTNPIRPGAHPPDYFPTAPSPTYESRGEAGPKHSVHKTQEIFLSIYLSALGVSCRTGSAGHRGGRSPRRGDSPGVQAGSGAAALGLSSPWPVRA